MLANYPTDRSTFMSAEGPEDPRFKVPNGTLQFNAQRDACFPYLYSLPTHALMHSPEHIKNILIHIVDTSVDDRIA